MNKAFSDWTEYLAQSIEWRNTAVGGQKYACGKEKELYYICRQHETEHEKPLTSENVLFITHPLYMHLSHMDSVKGANTNRDARQYLDSLMNLLHQRAELDLDIVLLDTVHHYAAATSLLLEAGLVDRVMFTHYSEGHLVHPEEFCEFRNKQIFFAGAYNEKCVTESIIDARKMLTNPIHVVVDLLINSPIDEPYAPSLLSRCFLHGHYDRIEGISKVALDMLKEQTRKRDYAFAPTITSEAPQNTPALDLAGVNS